MVTDDGRAIGQVSSLLETGAHDVLVVKPHSADEDVLIPFVEQYVTAVDMAERRISVKWEQDW